MPRFDRLALALSILIVASSAYARVISYSPYSDRVAIPAVQHRLNRHFVLVEQQPTNTGVPILSPPGPYFSVPPAQVVLYDSQGSEEPRVIFPTDGSFAPVGIAAAREESGVVSVLVQSTANFNGANPTNQAIWLMSNDSGSTWTKVELPSGNLITASPYADNGGFFVRSKYSLVRTGTREFPFVVAIVAGNGAGIYAVASNGAVKPILSSTQLVNNALLGSDREGQQFLVRTSGQIVKVRLDGSQSNVATLSSAGLIEGWIRPNGDVFLEHFQNTGQVVLYLATASGISPLAASWDGSPSSQPPINSSWVFFAVPSANYAGAWMIKRGGGRPTTLLEFGPTDTLPSPPPFAVMERWVDVSAPEVEALHPSLSGNKVLIQVHRPRQSVDNLMFKDPALAVWHAGDPAPKFYDELFLSESSTKAFVHVDVDLVETGAPFVFDSGATPAPGGGIIFSPPPAAGGSDVVQEWGVVRASLRQQLVLPGVGHAAGAFGSNWASDVTFYNPSDSPLTVFLNYRPNGASPLPKHPVPAFSITLQGHQIQLIPDIVNSFFHDTGVGALYITPDAGAAVNVTGRTYNTTSNGTYGFTMNGIDIYTAAGPRFPLTFSGAFEGANFRTNLTLTDVAGRGTEVNATAASNGSSFNDIVTFVGPNSGQTQINGITSMFGLSQSDTGALVLRPQRGETLAGVFVVDNRTNDATFFPPDIPASVMRVIPAIGHLDGANGSKFRSDLYLFNNSSQVKTVTLQAKLWDVPQNPTTIPFTLLPFEARVIRDVLLAAFGKTGIARLRFTAQGSTNDTSVRVTSRTYTIDPSGGTYGFLMPPLNSFQSGGAGDTLEILGATLDPHFRTNLGLVDLTGFPGPRPARAKIEIIDDAGASLDHFEVSVPSAGGMQLNDLFHSRGLPDSTKPVLIRVTTIEGMIGAYAAFVDNGTNDSAYVAANLAAKQ
jgi:hypothetical protein